MTERKPSLKEPMPASENPGQGDWVRVELTRSGEQKKLVGMIIGGMSEERSKVLIGGLGTYDVIYKNSDKINVFEKIDDPAGEVQERFTRDVREMFGHKKSDDRG